MMTKKTTERPLKHHVDQISWIIDPGAEPEHLLKLLLARFEETDNVWVKYEVKSSEKSFRYYCYIFVLSALAYRWLQRQNQGQVAISEEQLVQFPLHANEPVYGRMVKYYYNLKGKEKGGKARRHLAIPPMLREGMRAIFKPRSKGSAAKNARIDAVGVTKESFRFWNTEQVPVDIFSDQTLKELDIDKLKFSKVSIDIKAIDDSIRRIRLSKHWGDWEKGLKSGHEQNFAHLRHIEDVLEIGKPEEPQWFRRTGPIAVDFERGTFYRRKERLEQLKPLVMDNAVAMLIGVPAAGKTVLALNLAYELYDAGKTQAYYFDCDRDRDFDLSKLVDDIRSVKGVFILENVHLAAEKFQLLYSDFRHDPARHILFTSRPSFLDFQYSRSKDMTQIKTLEIEPFEEVDELIEAFSSHSQTPSIHSKARVQIKRMSTSSFWLLSYALKGCAKNKGKGDPKGWLKTGVQKDLNDLKNINPVFPEVLVTLSPLYRHEVLTAESYLTDKDKLGFDYKVLVELVKRGEITSQKTEEGTVLYGLPHTALADVYWRHGQEYRKRRHLPDYETFIYDYAVSDTPNGLRAVASAWYTPFNKILERLCQTGEITGVVERETYFPMGGLWFGAVCKFSRDQERVLRVIAEKISSLPYQWEFAQCLGPHSGATLHARQTLWALIDRKKFAERLSSSIHPHLVGSSILQIHFGHEDIGRELLGLLDLEQLAARITEGKSIEGVGWLFHVLWRFDPKRGELLWTLIDKKAFRRLMNQTTDTSVLAYFLENTKGADSTLGHEMWDLLEVPTLSRSLNGTEDIYGLGGCLKAVYQTHPDLGAKLWKLLDKGRLARKLCQPSNLAEASICLHKIYEGNEDAGEELWRLLHKEGLIAKLAAADDIEPVYLWLSEMSRISTDLVQQIWGKLDHGEYARKVNQTRNIGCVEGCINHFVVASRPAAFELCQLLDSQHLAEMIIQAGSLEMRTLCINAIRQANPKKFNQVLELVQRRRDEIDGPIYKE